MSDHVKEKRREMTEELYGSHVVEFPEGAELVSRCQICGDPFIYDLSVLKGGGKLAGEKRDDVWAHEDCFK